MSRRKGAKENQIRKRVKRDEGGKRPDKNVVTAMHNEHRAQILILLNERVASRPEISKELGISLDKVRYELDVLKKTNPPLIELEFEKPVRGTVEKFYRATKKAYLSPSEWPNVPDAARPGMRGSLLGILVDDAVAAVTEGTFDALENAHMSWNPMLLDAQGWEDIVSILYRAMKEASKVKEESAERLIAANAKGTSCTVSILGYASANEERKAGPTRGESRASQVKERKGKGRSRKAAGKKAKTRRPAGTTKARPKGKDRGKKK